VQAFEKIMRRGKKMNPRLIQLKLQDQQEATSMDRMESTLEGFMNYQSTGFMGSQPDLGKMTRLEGSNS
jgi:hypothetical protein